MKDFLKSCALFCRLVLFITIFNAGVCIGESDRVSGDESSLVAYWNFNEGQGDIIKDSSPLGNDGKVANAIWSKEGKVGSGLEFRGEIGSYGLIPPSMLAEITDAITIEVWVKLNAWGKDHDVIVTQGWHGFRIQRAVDEHRFRFGFRTDAGGEEKFFFVYTPEVPLDKWCHIAGTYDSLKNELKMYFNGMPFEEVECKGKMLPSKDKDLWIGTAPGGGSAVLNGIVDELKIYNRALSEKEIMDDFVKSGGIIDETLKPNPLPQINYFENDEEINRWVLQKARMERSSEYTSEGKYSGKVTFQPGDGQFIKLTRTAYASKDWSGFGMLAFDMYNATDRKIDFVLQLDTLNGPLYTPLSFSIAPQNWYTHHFCLLMPREFLLAEDKWGINDIQDMVVFLSGRHDKETTIYIDNVRLITKDETRAYYELARPSVPPKDAPVIPQDIFVSIPQDELSRVRALKVLWMDKRHIDVPRGMALDKLEAMGENFGTLKAVLRNQLDCYVGSPSSLNELKTYDIVIFDDVHSNAFTTEQIEWVKEFYKQGGAVVMLGGWASFGGHGGDFPGYRDTPIEEILPVKLLPPPDGSGTVPKLKPVDPTHPVMRGIPWETFPMKCEYNRVVPKDGTEVLAIDGLLKGDNPLIVIGDRVLVFTGADCRGGAALINWQPWERFIVQAFNYITRDKLLDRVVIERIDLQDSFSPGAVISGKIYLSNFSRSERKLRLSMDMSQKGISSRVNVADNLGEYILKPEEKEIPVNFSINIQSNLTYGDWNMIANLIEENRILDVFGMECVLVPSPHIKIVLSPPNYVGENLSAEIIIKNIPESFKSILEASLEKDGEKLSKVLVKEVILTKGKEENVPITLNLNDIQKGRYGLVVLVRNLDTKRIIGEKKESVWIYPKESDFVYMDQDFMHNSQEALVILPEYESMGFFRQGYGPVIDIYLEWQTSLINTMFPRDVDLTTVTKRRLTPLAEKKIPYYISLFHGWMVYEPYEILLERVRLVIKLAEEIGGDLFRGVYIGETNAFRWEYRAVNDKKKVRLERADGYIRLMKRLKDDLHLPPGKELILNPPNLYSGLDYEAGADIVSMETPTGGPGNFPLILSEGRGAGRSFHRKWEYSFALEPNLVGYREDAFYWNKKTLRYDPQVKTAKFQEVWDYWPAETMHKMLIEKYYGGVNSVWNVYRPPFKQGIFTEEGEAVLHFLDFIDDNQRTDEVVSKAAIMRSKGCYWGGPGTFPVEDDAKYGYHHIYGLGQWVIDGLPLKEEADYHYLNLFYPDFSDDLVLSRNWWTGTPYGAIDIVYPVISLTDMKRYDSIIFMGYNRMDSVRDDFLNDLIRYVAEGGIVVLSGDQLMNSMNELDNAKLETFIGTRIREDKIKMGNLIEVIEPTQIGLTKRSYEIPDEMKLYGEKEPWLYDVELTRAKVVARDSNNRPVLLMNRYGKGMVYIFTTPTLSIIPPTGKSMLIKDVIDKVVRFKGLPIDILPQNKDIEFFISKTGNSKAQVFVMNHGVQDWEGDVILNIDSCGLSYDIGNSVTINRITGYNVESFTPEVENSDSRLLIKKVNLQGDKNNFISYRQTSLALIKLEAK